MTFARRKVVFRVSLVMVLGIVFTMSVPSQTAVRPPKFDYKLVKLENGLTVILSEVQELVAMEMLIRQRIQLFFLRLYRRNISR